MPITHRDIGQHRGADIVVEMDPNALSESSLTTCELEQLGDLDDELNFHTDEIEENVVETVIGEQEVEIVTEEVRGISPDEILPDIKEEAEECGGGGAAPPPLRPLTIAPKPVAVKMPTSAGKAQLVGTNAGQQIVVIQSPGGTSGTVSLGGQQIKLISPQGQSVSIQNIQNLSAKQGTVTLRPAAKTMTVSQPKSFVEIKKQVVIAATTAADLQHHQPQQVKLLTTAAGSLVTSSQSPTKTITLAQAQQMGLLTAGKLQQVVPQSPTRGGIQSAQQQQPSTIIINKAATAAATAAATTTGKTIKVVQQVKTPTKLILPAPQMKTQLKKTQQQQQQRVIIRQGGQFKTSTTVLAAAGGSGQAGGQIIRLPSQTLTAGQIHQINVPGKGVQYVRLMATTNAATMPAAATAATAAATLKLEKTKVGSSKQVVASAGKVQQNVLKTVAVSPSQTRPVAPKPMAATTTQRVLIPASSQQTRTVQSLPTISATTLSQIPGAALIPAGSGHVSQIVMLPANYIQQLQNHPTTKLALSPVKTTTVSAAGVAAASSSSTATATIGSSSSNAGGKSASIKILPPQIKEQQYMSSPDSLSGSFNDSSSTGGGGSGGLFSRTLEPNGIRPRKPCNCTKSQCLKLYCDCFANGEFCNQCNCMNCLNNLEKEEERQKAIKSCLERNPNAFRPKIGRGRDAGETTIRKHTKGCNCKRSGCLKNYCECYEAKIACSNNCKCFGCRNIEDTMEKRNLRPLAAMPEIQNSLTLQPTVKNKPVLPAEDITKFRPTITNPSLKRASNFMTYEVIEATNCCMVARADEAERNLFSDEEAVKNILEEFGRCLVEIIECAQQVAETTAATASSPTTTAAAAAAAAAAAPS